MTTESTELEQQLREQTEKRLKLEAFMPKLTEFLKEINETLNLIETIADKQPEIIQLTEKCAQLIPKLEEANKADELEVQVLQALLDVLRKKAGQT